FVFHWKQDPTRKSEWRASGAHRSPAMRLEAHLAPLTVESSLGFVILSQQPTFLLSRQRRASSYGVAGLRGGAPNSSQRSPHRLALSIASAVTPFIVTRRPARSIAKRIGACLARGGLRASDRRRVAMRR